MIKIKFFVLVICFVDLFACSPKYCNICPEHTLCIYEKKENLSTYYCLTKYLKLNPGHRDLRLNLTKEVSGPSAQCVGYNTDALLTEDDIIAILDKINERRNFIASGRSRFLPAAANMKKMVWSKELATFAQRWVDQCDQSLKPDRQDKCRDLDYSEVGQSIVSIKGPSNRYKKLHVRSMVEVWFMESMDYTGSVAYYNQSKDHKTNYFTQLIWADTDKVGCGKASFFVKSVKPVIVDRLVCNFSPRGNENGKPVYTIGYPATQCDGDLESDVIYPGLCSHRLQSKGKVNSLSSTNTPSTSLLRILNLFNNDSSRQEIDLINGSLRKLRKDLNDNNKYQTTIQIQQYNNSYDAVKRSYSFNNKTIWDSQQPNNSTYYHGDYIKKREKAHPRVSHHHDHKNEFDYLHSQTVNQQKHMYDYTSLAPTLIYMEQEQDHRKHNVEQKCTRKTAKKLIGYETTDCDSCKKEYKCTRGLKTNYPNTNGCVLTTNKCGNQDCQTTTLPTSREFCECSSFSTAFKPTCAYNTNCDCVNVNCPTKPCRHMLKNLKDSYDEKLDKQSDFHYYDNIFPYKQHTTNRPIMKDLQIRRISLDDNPWSSRLKSLDRRKQQRNYSERKRRMPNEEEDNFKPFWQMDEYVNSNQPQLKSMRYTTLSKRKNLKNQRSRKQPKSTAKTESITVTFRDRNNIGKRVTEKYLSFDELMHLRKINAEESGGRRYYDDKQILRESNATQAASETTTTESPTKNTLEYSFNTPYIRMKHCTRKLTCTWTAASLTDNAGSIIPGGGNAVGGSRTPPGYVEGCTRTSTCTRDYMNRNKMATLPIETTSPEPEPTDDDDYCERRSLNRRSNNNLFFGNDNKTIKSSEQTESLFNETFHNCICYDINNRTKRHDKYAYNVSVIRNKNLKRESVNHMNYETNLLSYGDLYYYVINKIIETWKIAKKSYPHNKCICNSSNKIRCSNYILICLFKIFVYIYN